MSDKLDPMTGAAAYGKDGPFDETKVCDVDDTNRAALDFAARELEAMADAFDRNGVAGITHMATIRARARELRGGR